MSTTSKSIQMYLTDNFKNPSLIDLPDEGILQKYDSFYDIRNSMLSVQTDFTDLEWYYNYLDTNAYFAVKNPDAYVNYMPALGYIPIVFLPSCCEKFSIPMLGVLDKLEVPYIKLVSMSFTIKFCKMETTDAWVSKLDISKMFNIPITEIRSSKIARRLFDGEFIG